MNDSERRRARAKATATVSNRAGAQSKKPPKLTTWGTACRTAEAAAGRQSCRRKLTRGTSARSSRATAIVYGSGPDQPETAGSALQVCTPEIELVQDSAPPGTNCAAKASRENAGVASARTSTARRWPRTT